MPDERQQTDLVLPVGVYAFILDTTSGNVNVHVGPRKQPLSNQQDMPVIMNGGGRFETVDKDKAIKPNVVAGRAEYIVLRNPAKEDKQPQLGKMSILDPDLLRMGEKVNMPGPAAFPLWPMQVAEVIPGHHLKSNQYLVVRVYDEDAARKNWNQSTIKLVSKEGQAISDDQKENPSEALSEIDLINADELMIGQQLVIKGTEVSFFIPPTGIEVLKEAAGYTREALTLERLEYCLLIDENGNKRYVRGPEVVFPRPTEQFKMNDDDERKSRAYELNENSGVHIKVIAAYKDDFGIDRKEGEELFITGHHTEDGGSEEETSIYFPRVEHAIIKYDNNTRYHATAIPPGESKYVMDRLTGRVRIELGPSMFLPDPRREVVALRILSENEVATYYPGNARVAQYNEQLRLQSQENEGATASAPRPDMTGMRSSNVMYASVAAPPSSRVADTLMRGTKVTKLREVLLDPKWSGAIKIKPWTGFAVQIVNQAGERRVEIGPKTIALEFDERLDVLLLSTGTPKSADRPLSTVYLRVSNNSVSDIFVVKTKDMVPVKITLKYLCRFDEEYKDRWFSIDNYIQNMVDRFRSLANNHARLHEVKEFYAHASTHMRDLILGEKPEDGRRPGHLFEENGMRVYELDVLGVEIVDANISAPMMKLQTDRIKNGLEAELLSSNHKLAIAREEIQRQILSMSDETSKLRHVSAMVALVSKHAEDSERSENEHAIELAEVDQAEQIATKRVEVARLEAESARLLQAQIDEREVNMLDRNIKMLLEQAKADKSRIEVISPQLTQALVALANTGALGLVSQHLGDLAIIRNQSLGGIFETMFEGTPLEGLLKNLKQLGAGAVVGK